MENRRILTKTLATLGTVLVWIPLLFTVVTSVIRTISTHILRFDYLMPAELFPIALVGALLLLWAAQRAHSKQNLLVGLVGCVSFSFGGQLLL